MEFSKILLKSNCIEAQILFYEKLGFHVESDSSSFEIQAGKTTLAFEKSDNELDMYHFAFLICDSHFEDCLAYVKSKGIDLIVNAETGEEIVYWDNNTGRTFYFYDEDGNIVEFITRPSLGYTSNNEWALNEIIKINEIGTPVADTIATSQSLIEDFGLRIPQYYIDRFHERFCWFGDYEGTILIVKNGRHWYPTDIPARSSDLKLQILQDNKVVNLSFQDKKFN